MDGVDKILSGYYLPVILLLTWTFIGVIRAIIECLIKSRQRTISLQQSLLPVHDHHHHDGINDNNENKRMNDDDESKLLLDDDNDNRNGNGDDAHQEVDASKCCYGKLMRPTISLIVLHTVLFAYSSIVKTTMSLLQCRPSPVNDQQMIIYSSGAITCYNHWYTLHIHKHICN
jgi:hypothetical protein